MDRLPEQHGFDWIYDMCLSEGACVTFTEHDDVRHVAAAFGGRMDHAVLIEGVRPLDEALTVVEERFPGTWPIQGLPVALFARLPGWVITFEDKGGEGIRKEVLERASRTSRAASVFWNVNMVTHGAFAEHGRILAEVSDGTPVVHGAGDGRIDAALEGVDWEDGEDDLLDSLFTLSARLTGQVFTPESLNGEFLAVPLVRWPQPDADGRLLMPELDGALGDALRSADEGSLRRAALAAARYAVSVAGISSHPVITDTLAAWPERPALLERMARSVGSLRADDPNRIPQLAPPARAEPMPADDPAGGSRRIDPEAMRNLLGYPVGVSSSESGHAMAVQALVQATETSAPAIAAYRAIAYADEARRELRRDVTKLREAVMRAFAAS